MRKPSTRKITTKPVSAKPVPATPAPLAGGFVAPSSIKPGTVNTKPVAAIVDAAANAAAAPVIVPTVPAVPAVAKPSANITRTAATVVRNATNFAVLSDRDTAYLAFYGKLAKRASDGIVTLAAIVQAGERPAYAGSNKPHDAGVIVRLTKAGILTPNADGHGFAISATGRTHRAFTGATA